MPARWFVPIPGLDPTRVKLGHVHGAVSAWFDHTLAEHRAGDKPYAVSPPTRDEQGETGVEVATLTGEATDRLGEATESRPSIRLGNQSRRIGRVRCLHAHTWAQLASPVEATEWRLELATPTTFRSGNRSTPLPTVESLVRGARQAWTLWGDDSLPGGQGSSLWVSDLDLRSEVVPLVVRGADGRHREITLSGVTGTIVVRHDPGDAAAAALVRATAYTGIGAMTVKGLGVTRVRAHQRARAAGLTAPRVEAATGGAAR
jgi:CRISPR-associated endoribonuclease Cas6